MPTHRKLKMFIRRNTGKVDDDGVGEMTDSRASVFMRDGERVPAYVFMGQPAPYYERNREHRNSGRKMEGIGRGVKIANT